MRTRLPIPVVSLLFIQGACHSKPSTTASDPDATLGASETGGNDTGTGAPTGRNDTEHGTQCSGMVCDHAQICVITSDGCKLREPEPDTDSETDGPEPCWDGLRL